MTQTFERDGWNEGYAKGYEEGSRAHRRIALAAIFLADTFDSDTDVDVEIRRIRDAWLAEQRPVITDDMRGRARSAIHRSVASDWMNLFMALGGTQSAYDAFLGTMADVALEAAFGENHQSREREQVMDRYQVVTLQAAVYVVDNDEMQASRFAGDWNAHASCELLNSGAMPRTDLDWIDLEPESGDPS